MDPLFSIGETIIWKGGYKGYGSDKIVQNGIYYGVLSWIGKIEELGKHWIVGIDFANPIEGGNEGTWKKRPIFNCKPGCGLFLPIKDIFISNNLIDYCSRKTFSRDVIKNYDSNETSLLAESKKYSPANKGMKFSIGKKSVKKSSNIVKEHKKNNKTSKSSQKTKDALLVSDGKQIYSEKGKTTKGFPSIFKWFSKKDVKKTNSLIAKTQTNVNALSGTNSTNDLSFIPLKHSASAGDSEEMIKAHKISKYSSQRRNSLSGYVGSGNEFSSLRIKKRMAPPPPDSRKDTNFTPGKLLPVHCMKKTKSEGSVYPKVKRKAPQPPCNLNSFDSKSFSMGSSIITGSSISSSFSSYFKSLNDSTCSTLQSESDTLNSSDLSLNFANVNSPMAKGLLSPKPWYKRKNKNAKDKKFFEKSKNIICDALMPNINFVRRKVDSHKSNTLKSEDSGIYLTTVNRMSILSNISDLDRAASEIIERKKMQSLTTKEETDDKYYKPSVHMLNQKDIVPIEETKLYKHLHSLDTKLSVNSLHNSTTYDNLHYSKNAEVHFKKSINKMTETKSKETILYNNYLDDSEINDIQNINYEEYLEEIRKEISNDSGPIEVVKNLKETPLQQATFDPELFYQLAKDAKVTCGSKLSVVNKDNPSQKDKNSIAEKLSQPKSFGLRMNNFFTPDVSVILETSESLTSSNTTNIHLEDLGSINFDTGNDVMSNVSDLNSDIRINTCDLQDIIESFAGDLNKSEESNNEQNSKESKSKAEKIRDEVLFLREKDHFLAWQKTMQERENLSKKNVIVATDKKKKWCCSDCTLLNYSWRINCEACGSTRSLALNENESKLNKNHNPKSKKLLINQNNEEASIWEGELQHYIDNFDKEAKNIKEIYNGNIRNQLINSENLNHYDNLENEYGELYNGASNYNVSKNTSESNFANYNKIYQENQEIDRLRKARIRKFHGIQNNFERNGTTAQYSHVIKNTVQNGRNKNLKDVFPTNEEKNFYKNEHKKSAPVIKPNGAVKSVVSIFNQLEELNKAVKNEKPNVKTTGIKLRNTSPLIKEFQNTFISRNETTEKEPRNLSPIKADIDISNAINKFDEMAAMAEIEKINKLTAVSKEKLNSSKLHDNSGTSINDNLNESTLCNSFGIYKSDDCSISNNQKEINELYKNLKGTRDSAIKNGVLYTPNETTFELLSAEDFSNIEVHHSRRSSFIEDTDSPSASELIHPMLMPEITVDDSNDQNINMLNYFKNKINNLNSSELQKDHSAAASKNYLDSSKISKRVEISCRNPENNYLPSTNNNIPNTFLNRDLKPLSNDLDTDDSLDGSIYMKSQQSSYNSPSFGSLASNTTDSSSFDFIDYTNQTASNVQQITEFESNNVVRRTNKIDPKRRQVKSDFASHNIQNMDHAEPLGKFRVKMYVEDKSSHQGPTIIFVESSMTVGDLKFKISQEFGFPYEVQRWILGRQLADDNIKTLGHYNVTANGCPIFLYLVAPEAEQPMSLSAGQTDFKDNGESCKDSAQNKDKKHNISQPKKSRSKRKVSNKREKIQSPKSKEFVSASGAREKTNVKSEHSSTKGWTCPQCTLINACNRPGCEACSAERPLLNTETKVKQKMNLRQALTLLESNGCVPNSESFECPVCFSEFKSGQGIVLRDCLHQFCRDCLANAAKYSETAEVKCPFSDRNYTCNFSLQEREIKDLLSDEEYHRHMERSLKQAAGAMKNIFYCKTPDCNGFCQYEDNVNTYICTVCNKLNCLTCQVQHPGKSCKQFQDDLANKIDESTVKTKKLFEDIIRRGDGMFCPQCSVMLIRKWGCDWMRCPMCKTEICWVTQGPRWGPNGQGDTSGGCKCGINGRKCHPKCTYCH